jgi:predicted transcriptional regulator
MTHTHPIKILFQSVDCFGNTWNVTEVRPTEHGWNILAGYPAVNRNRLKLKGIMGPARTILTPELCAYLEEFRMKRGTVRLPLSSTTICKLRRKLGMNYWHDCKAWWQETEDTKTSDPSSLQNDAPLKPRNLMWTRSEISQARELLNNGISVLEIANILGKKEKTVFKLRQRLFGLKRGFWTPEEEEKLLEGVRENLPLATVAEDLGRSLSSIKGKLIMLKEKGVIPKKDKAERSSD